jgi:microcompartment protein CcmL/EutN
MFIGLDVHKATISVAVADGKRGGEVRSWGVIPHRAGDIQKVVEKLGSSGRHLHFAMRQVLAGTAFIDSC